MLCVQCFVDAYGPREIFEVWNILSLIGMSREFLPGAWPPERTMPTVSLSAPSALWLLSVDSSLTAAALLSLGKSLRNSSLWLRGSGVPSSTTLKGPAIHNPNSHSSFCDIHCQSAFHSKTSCTMLSIYPKHVKYSNVNWLSCTKILGWHDMKTNPVKCAMFCQDNQRKEMTACGLLA